MMLKKNRLCFASLFAFLIFSMLALSACDKDKTKTSKPAAKQEMPLLEKLGNFNFPITTTSKQAQQYFDQGMVLAYGFNHRGAMRSFKMASKLDPNAAMPYWGQAYVLGPNLNLPMSPKDEKKADDLIEKAKSLSQNVTPKEKDYINALSKRYTDADKPNRQALDKDWANAAASLHEKYPNDPNASTLYASSLMLLRPWNYWQGNGDPYLETKNVIPILEKGLKQTPNHVGLIHYYIHIAEASPDPYRAEAAADRLNKMNINAGHLTHMPSHIYMRIGRYDDAIEANKRSIKMDEDYIRQLKAKGVYPEIYYPHNVHFLAWAYMLQGRSDEALRAASKSAKVAKRHPIQEKTFLNSFAVIPYFALLRFQQWDALLKMPAPPSDQPYVEGMWLYATGIAYTRLGMLDHARGNLEALQEIAQNPKARNIPLLSYNLSGSILDIAVQALEASIAYKRGKVGQAIRHYEKGIALEDNLNYNEPPDWLVPLRQRLGFIYLERNEPAKAQAIFEADLKKQPDTGWSLLGLYKSLNKQGKTDAAAKVKEKLQKAWDKADEDLRSEY
jgi:tetratricopeptide (TPR) repeat protein